MLRSERKFVVRHNVNCFQVTNTSEVVHHPFDESPCLQLAAVVSLYRESMDKGVLRTRPQESERS